MSKFDELIKNKIVANHPLLEGYRNLPEIGERTAQSIELGEHLSDMFSRSPYEEERRKDINSLMYEASVVVADSLAQFDFPMHPKVSFNGAKDVKFAKHDETEVIDAVIHFTAQVMSKSGVRKDLEIPVPISSGMVMPPSMMKVDGKSVVLSQHSIDQVMDNNTSFELPPLREHQFSPPMSKFEKEMAVEMRNTMGWQAREIEPEHYMNQKQSAKKEAIKATPSGFDQALDLMKTAKEAGEDTFPRPWHHVLRHYVLEVVSTAHKDKWEPHLINLGYCINPNGHATNSRSAARTAQAAPDFRSSSAADELVNSILSDEQTALLAQNIIENQQSSSFISLGEALQRELGDEMDPPFLWTEVAEELYRSFINLEESMQFEGAKQSQLYHGVEDLLDDDLGMEKEIELEVSDIPETVWERMYPETRTPIEVNDSVKFKGHGGNSTKGMIVDIDADNDFLIIKSKGMEYRINVEDIEPLPSTFKKMYE
ncbi:hypothetical protein N8Z24_00025 [bacterium]|nr:hypothetical protein [bacterium]